MGCQASVPQTAREPESSHVNETHVIEQQRQACSPASQSQAKERIPHEAHAKQAAREPESSHVNETRVIAQQEEARLQELAMEVKTCLAKKEHAEAEFKEKDAALKKWLSPEVYQIFVSFRVAEAKEEALALKAALEDSGFRTFCSSSSDDVRQGDDWVDPICEALGQIKLFVILGTETYGAKGVDVFATSQEMEFAMREKKALYIVPMYKEGWKVNRTEVLLGSMQVGESWNTEPSKVPKNLLEDILSKAAKEHIHPTDIQERARILELHTGAKMQAGEKLHAARAQAENALQAEAQARANLKGLSTSMQIHVRFLTGKTITLGVKSSNTIVDVKRKIQDKTGKPPERRRLFFAKKRQEDDSTLADCGIEDDDMLLLVIKP